MQYILVCKREQYKQSEQSEQPEQSEQSEQREQREQYEQSEQYLIPIILYSLIISFLEAFNNSSLFIFLYLTFYFLIYLFYCFIINIENNLKIYLKCQI